MKRHSYILVIAAVALLAVGCRSTRQAATAPVEVAAPQAPQRQLSVITFTAIVEGISASGQMRVAEDSVLWVSVNKLIELGRAKATKDSVWVTTTFGDHHFAGSYDDLQRLTKRRITFDEMQAMAMADDGGEQISRLAASLGFNATVYITGRRKVDRLTFPFKKE